MKITGALSEQASHCKDDDTSRTGRRARCSQQPRKAMEFERDKVRESEGNINVTARPVRQKTSAQGLVRHASRRSAVLLDRRMPLPHAENRVLLGPVS